MELTPKDLAKRWRMNVKTLDNWRNADHGPSYIKRGWAVFYPIAGVKEFEKKNPQLLAERYGKRISPTR